MPKQNKRKCSFSDALQRAFPCPSEAAGKRDADVFCKRCKATFPVGHGGRSDIDDHCQTMTHKLCADSAAGSSSSSNANYFGTAASGPAALNRAAAEGTYAYHVVKHDHGLRSTDCASALRRLSDEKFYCAPAKTEALVTDVLAPLAMEDLKSDTSSVHFVSVAIDVCNTEEVKLVPIVLRYFKYGEGAKVKILAFASVPAETSAILLEEINHALEKYNLRGKVVGFCADHTNANFGGKKRAGENSVVFKFNEGVSGNSVIGVGCAARIVHNAVQTAADCLPVDIEGVVVKICKYFHIYTVRTEELSEFCEFADSEYQRLLGSSNARWLSLKPAVDGVLKWFPALKSYFSSQENVPTTIVAFFENPVGEAWLWFVHHQLSLFSDAIKAMEKRHSSAIDVAVQMITLKEKLMARREACFMGLKVKHLLGALPDEGTSQFRQNTLTFYGMNIDYLDEWGADLMELHIFTWSLLNDVPAWEDVEHSLEFVMSRVPNFEIREGELFDETSCVIQYTRGRTAAWKEEKMPAAERWVETFTHFRNRGTPFQNIGLLVEFVMCLPGSNAPVERICSITDKAWADGRHGMDLATLKATLVTRVNFDLSCADFHDQLLRNRSALQKIQSSDGNPRHQQ
ncbi:uncharacterized protein LOC142475230 isoform X1 [Ascaphus truei]|uniref:uncharacterized protein LOC142475230 isoform X1 n=1 Tax=Ascaphus truei TaxID=8439 RepID=UPI003F59D428